MACQKTNNKFTCYQDRLKLMKLETLEFRRIRFDLIYMYKIFNNMIDIDFHKHFKGNIASQTYNLRGHNFKLQRSKYSGSEVRNRFFCERVIQIWNDLPKEIVESPNIYNFKKELDKFNLNTIYTSKV